MSGSQPEVSAVTGARAQFLAGGRDSDRGSVRPISDKAWRPGEIESI